jgi:hypothetical protein
LASDNLLTPWLRFRRWRWWWQALAWLALPPLPVAIWAASQPRHGRGLAWGLVILVTGAWLSVGWAADASDSTTTAAPASAPLDEDTSSTSTTAAPTTVTTATPPTMPGPPATAAPPGPTAAGTVDQLIVAPETSGDDYDRELFLHWVDTDGDGCDTRCEVLEVERRPDLPGLPGGGWLSIYDGYSTPDAGELDIDHVVALAEAWRSGANTWDAAQREVFANDLGDPGALIAVTASSNLSKRDRDPASWQPPNQGAWCEFAGAWVTTKVRWALTADPAEVGALRNMLVGCPELQ